MFENYVLGMRAICQSVRDLDRHTRAESHAHAFYSRPCWRFAKIMKMMKILKIGADIIKNGSHRLIGQGYLHHVIQSKFR